MIAASQSALLRQRNLQAQRAKEAEQDAEEMAKLLLKAEQTLAGWEEVAPLAELRAKIKRGLDVRGR